MLTWKTLPYSLTQSANAACRSFTLKLFKLPQNHCCGGPVNEQRRRQERDTFLVNKLAVPTSAASRPGKPGPSLATLAPPGICRSCQRRTGRQPYTTTACPPPHTHRPQHPRRSRKQPSPPPGPRPPPRSPHREHGQPHAPQRGRHVLPEHGCHGSSLAPGRPLRSARPRMPGSARLGLAPRASGAQARPRGKGPAAGGGNGGAAGNGDGGGRGRGGERMLRRCGGVGFLHAET